MEGTEYELSGSWYLYIFESMNIYVCICVYVCMRVRMYICVHIFIETGLTFNMFSFFGFKTWNTLNFQC